MRQGSYLEQYPSVRADHRGGITVIEDPNPLFANIEFTTSKDIHYTFNKLALDQIAIGATASSGHRVAIDDPFAVTVVLPLNRRTRVESAGDACVIDVGETGIVFPGRQRRTSEADSQSAMLKIPARALGANSGWLGRKPIVVRNETAVRRASLALVQELSSRASRPPARTIALWEALVFDALAVELQTEESSIAASARQVRLAEAYVRANLSEPLSVGSLAAQVGVSSRALQLAFRRHRNCSPHRYIALQRAAAVHARLSAARSGENVTTIALDLGVASLGRFAQLYRSLYGETPSDTLARGADGLR